MEPPRVVEPEEWAEEPAVLSRSVLPEEPAAPEELAELSTPVALEDLVQPAELPRFEVKQPEHSARPNFRSRWSPASGSRKARRSAW
jgi:hypothetical protein